MTAPDFAAKLDYFGITGLKLGAAIYVGDSESRLMEGIWKHDTLDNKQLRADSSTVGITMTGLDFRYMWKAFECRGQYILANLTNTKQYNTFTSKDLGSTMAGYYLEAGVNVLQWNTKTKNKLVIFTRYEKYDTHANTTGGLARNDTYNRTDITSGFSFRIGTGVVLKADYQRLSNAKAGSQAKNMFNMEIGFWF